MKLLERWSVTKKNTVIIYLIAFVALFFVSSMYYVFVETILVDALRESNEKTIEQYIDKVSYKANVYIALSKSVSSNTEIKEVLRKQNELDVSDTIDLHGIFRNTINKNLLINDINELNEITVYALNESFPTDGKFISNIHMGDTGWWFNRMEAEKGIIVFRKKRAFIEGQVSFIEAIVDYDLDNYGEVLGYVKVDVSANDFFEANDSFTNLVVYDEFKQHVWGEKSLEDNLDVYTRAFSIGRNNYKGDYTLKYAYDYDQIDSEIAKSRMYLIIVVTLLGGIMLVVRSRISKGYLHRINRMIGKIKRIETGDFKSLTVDEGKDEIGVLDAHFNEMAKKLDDLITTNYLQELENKEAKIKALQYQIDPHFLFNTLESINALAVIDDNEDISNIIESLGLIYRYIVDKETGDTVTLRQEINHVRNYVIIQQYRFGFDITYDIPAELEHSLVPKLIVQPFVENAINYAKGLSGKKLHLRLTVKRREDDLTIVIEDNGMGMEAQKLIELQENMNPNKASKHKTGKKSIGIQNVDQRIKLNYGDCYGVNITSELGKGTVIAITVPYSK